jgi:hypothetical protein
VGRVQALLAAFALTLASAAGFAGEQQVDPAGFPATLIAPVARADAPVVLIFSGSGPTNRDGNSPLGVSASYLAKVAKGLAALGIGSLRFDKRGIVGSPSAGREEDLTIATYAEDGAAVLDWLRSRYRGNAMILLGHSEGGLIALAVARMRPDVAGLVLLATPGLAPADTLRWQLQALDEPLREQALAIAAAIEAGKAVEDVPPPLFPIFRPTVQPFLRSLFAIRPAEDLARLPVPALVIGGGRDLQVGRADFERLVAARPDVEGVWFEALNHVLVDAPAELSENLRTYSDPDLPLSPGLVEVIGGFIRRTADDPR